MQLKKIIFIHKRSKTKLSNQNILNIFIFGNEKHMNFPKYKRIFFITRYMICKQITREFASGAR